MRTLVSAAAVVIALLLSAVAVPALWGNSNVVREDGFIALAAPLGEDEVFQKRLAAAAAASLESNSGIPAPLAVTGAAFVARAAEDLSTLPGYPEAWEETLRHSHRLAFQDTDAATASTSLTLDLAPLVRLLVEQVSGSTGFGLEAPEEVLFNVGTPAQRQQLEGLAAYTSLAWTLLLGAGVALLLAFVAARRRSVVAIWFGLGLVLLAGAWHVMLGTVSNFAQNQSSGNPIADLFKQQFVDSANAGFGGWISLTLTGGAALALAGIIGCAASSLVRRRSGSLRVG